MLSELVKESFNPRPRELKKGITGSSIRPCAYSNYISYHKLDPGEDKTAEEEMNMEDGHWQEQKAISHFRRAGIKVKNVTPQQMTLHFGKSRIIGHPDGLVEVDKERMLEVKAMSNMRFKKFSEGTLEGSIKCQTQAYLFSDELYNRVDEVDIYAICKESAEPFDRIYGREDSFIKPIIEELDEIILLGHTPKKELNNYCPSCYHQIFCWKTNIRDMTEPRVLSLPEAVDSWTKGKALKMAGEELINMNRPLIEEALGDSKTIILDGTQYSIKVQRIDSSTNYFNQSKFIKEFGLEALKKVMDSKDRVSIRIDAL